MDSLDKILGVVATFENAMADVSFDFARELRVLLYIAQHGGQAKSEIAEALGMGAGTVARALSGMLVGEYVGRDGQKLEKLGFIFSQQDPKDTRRDLCFLTEKGEQLVAELRRIINAA